MHKLLDACQARGLLKDRGRQRTDATHVLASIRVLNRLELLGETLRAALNELATVAPGWLRELASKDWYKRYGRRIEDGRLPRAIAEREAYARAVGEDGFALLDRLDRPETAAELRACRRSRSCARSGPATSSGRTGQLPAAARGSGRRRIAARGGAGRVALRHRGRASAPARAPPGSGTRANA